MKLHYLQHIHFENLANIEIWAKDRGHKVSRTRLFNNERLPAMGDFDWLIIMGGPMNIHQEKKYPWLIQEKRFIEKAIKNKKVVLGICLGAQLIADILGGKVYKNKYKEIGWFQVSLTKEAEGSSIFNTLPEKFIAFHWHGDTFDLPSGCIRIATSEGCINQAFEYKSRVVGLQFHLESSERAIDNLIQNCGDEIIKGRYTQKQSEILAKNNNLKKISKTLNLLLDNIQSTADVI